MCADARFCQCKSYGNLLSSPSLALLFLIVHLLRHIFTHHPVLSLSHLTLEPQQLLWLEHNLGFSIELTRHSSFVVWVLATIAFCVTTLSTVIAYPRSLSPLTSLPGAVVLWPIYTSATRTELFLYVLPMHFSINATFRMAFDEPREKMFFEEDEEVAEGNKGGVNERMVEVSGGYVGDYVF